MNPIIDKNAVALAMIMAFRVILQATSLILLTKVLGVELFGSYISFATIAIVLATLSSLGTNYLLLVNVSKASTIIEKVWNYSWPITLVIGGGLVFVFVGGFYFFSDNITSKTFLLWLGLTELIIVPLNTLLGSFLQANGRVIAGQLIQLLPIMARVLAVVACFIAVETKVILHFTVYHFILAVGALLVSYLYVNYVMKISCKPSLIGISDLKLGFKYSAMSASSSMASELDKILSVRYLTSFEAGAYNASSRVLSALILPVTAVLINVQLKIFSIASKPDLHSLNFIRKLGFVTLSIAVIICFGVHNISGIVIDVFGDEYQLINEILPYLGFAVVPMVMRRVAGSILAGLRTPTTNTLIEVFGLFMYIGLLGLVVPLYGLKGFIMSLISAEVAMATIAWFRVFKQHSYLSIVLVK